MTPRTIVLTGASSGIGQAAALALAARGHHVVPLGRDPNRTRAVGKAVGTDPVLLDLADLSSVRRAAEHLLALPDRVDVLALNAGAMFASHVVTTDGIEASLQTNHLGHFLLERLLHDRLVADRTVVVFTCSLAVHLGTLRSAVPDRSDRRYRMLSAYGDSKLAGLLFVRELLRRSRDRGLTAIAFHPGTTNTSLPYTTGGWIATQSRLIAPVARRLPGILTPAQGAATLVRLASGATPRCIGAHFLGPSGREAVLPRRATDRGLASATWAWSERLVGVG